MNSLVIRGRVVETPKFQRRHFEFVAAVIADIHESGTMSADDAETVAGMFADHLADTNDNFDKARFVAACMKGN